MATSLPFRLRRFLSGDEEEDPSIAPRIAPRSLAGTIGDVTGLGVIGEALGGIDLPDLPTSMDELIPDPQAPLPGAPPPAPPNPAAQWLKTGPGMSFLGGQEAAQEAASTQMATPASVPIRAVRMPGGQLVYTNQELPGERGPGVSTTEVPMEEAALASRRSLGRIDPTSRTMSALVRAAAAANQGDGATVGGGLSVMEGTPEQQRRLKYEEAMGAAALAGAQSDLEYQKLPLQAKSDLGNRDIQTMGFLQSLAARKRAAIEAAYAVERKRIDVMPLGPEREEAIKNLDANRDSQQLAIDRELLVLQGRTPQG